MRSVTTPFFPAQVEGAVTLQAVIDAREGDRLPLELALYVSGELGRQVAQLRSLGREGALDPKRVWCTSKGAVVVHEASTGEARGLGSLVYRLLSGSGEVSAWPPSYFNPSVAESLDAAVMSAVSGDKPEDTGAMVDALTAASSGLDQEASVTGMARLVFAVSDEPKPPASVAPSLPSSAPKKPVARRRAVLVAAAVVLAVAVLIGLATATPAAVARPPTQPATEHVIRAKSVREKTVEAFAAKKLRENAKASKKARSQTK